MKSYNVLDPTLDIHHNTLLEASAGTGKTFSIEHIVVRLLTEEKDGVPPLALEQILIMTFTKAAANDLKGRIRAKIQSTLHTTDDPGTRRALERALFCFDDARIFTLHGFCARMLRENVLEGDLSLDAIGGDKKLPKDELLQIIKDYFKIGITPDRFSKEQLALLIDSYHGNGQRLEESLLTLALKGDIAERRTYSELHDTFLQAIKQLRYDPERLRDDFAALLPRYNKIKQEEMDDCYTFSALFADDGWDFSTLIKKGFPFLNLLVPENHKKKFLDKPPPQLHYPHLLTELHTVVKPLLDEARNPHVIELRMAHGCRALIQQRLQQEEKMTFDELLSTMHRAVQNPDFATLIRNAYRAAIIDEFQDTDPTQWQIFRTLFLDTTWKGNLYIVGDPKQSIYGFRQADIYCYLDAADAIGKENIASLDTNYRSTPELIHGINILFSSDNAPGLIALPKRNSALPYHPVRHPDNAPHLSFTDNVGAVHFIVGRMKVERSNSYPHRNAEEIFFLPYTIEEILRLHTHHNVSYRQFVILVSDRFQARRVEKFLAQYQIPCTLQRSGSLADATALTALHELVTAVLSYHDSSAVRIALGGRLIGWTHTELFHLDDQEVHEEILLKFSTLQQTLIQQGFPYFFHEFLNSCWHDDEKTVAEHLLKRDGGDAILNELTQIAELIMDEQTTHHLTADTLPDFLDSFAELKDNDDERLNIRQDPMQDAVIITTIHSSKGLEYDFVFALGVIKRSPASKKMIYLLDRNGKTVLDAVDDKESSEFLRYCDEVDAEKIRQLYVTLTRARYRVYIPTFVAEGSKPARGCASPLELLLARLGQPYTADNATLYERILLSPTTALDTFIPAHFTTTPLIASTSPTTAPPPPAAPLLTVATPFPIPGEPHYLHSFTALSKHHHSTISGEKLPAPHDFLSNEKTPHTLPSSSETGNLLHKILEDIPFNTHSTADFIKPYIAGTPFEPWLEPLATIVSNALSTPIDGFPLSTLNPGRCFRETEFLYPCAGVDALEQIDVACGYVKGVIDLIFFHNDKYYIVDWKSNWLGSSVEDYSQERLKQAMHENQYDLQAAIYKEAARRYLRLLDPRPFEEIFGGSYYLFLRGVGKKHHGVYPIC